jgi:hypothetical protein
MESINKNELFTDLSTDEATNLNGGGYCRYAYVLRCVRYGWYRYCAYAYVYQCY